MAVGIIPIPSKYDGFPTIDPRSGPAPPLVDTAKLNERLLPRTKKRYATTKRGR